MPLMGRSDGRAPLPQPWKRRRRGAPPSSVLDFQNTNHVRTVLCNMYSPTFDVRRHRSNRPQHLLYSLKSNKIKSCLHAVLVRACVQYELVRAYPCTCTIKFLLCNTRAVRVEPMCILGQHSYHFKKPNCRVDPIVQRFDASFGAEVCSYLQVVLQVLANAWQVFA